MVGDYPLRVGKGSVLTAGQRVGVGCLPRRGYGAWSEGVIVSITWGSAQKAGPRPFSSRVSSCAASHPRFQCPCYGSPSSGLEARSEPSRWTGIADFASFAGAPPLAGLAKESATPPLSSRPTVPAPGRLSQEWRSGESSERSKRGRAPVRVSAMSWPVIGARLMPIMPWPVARQRLENRWVRPM